ncbi:MAG: DUF167 domain-containing protein [Myxococcota bacterium]
MNEYISNCRDGIILRVILHPRANKNGIVGVYRDMLKIQVTAPPVDDSANEMLIDFLSDFLKIPKSSIKITIGKTSRQKILKIESDKYERIKSKIEKEITPDLSRPRVPKNEEFDLE